MREDTKACTFNVESQYVDLAAEVFSLLSDATRIRIILALRDGELSVGDLADRVRKSPTAVSQHLAKLRWGKIVQARQEGTRVFYSLIDEHARKLVAQAVFQAEHVVGGVPPHHLNGEGVPAAPAASDATDPASPTDPGQRT
ncbi:ArsR/SmtB family transcription factor [Propionibacterium freudenreichii]|uniref:ArsR/SmtB family transcription factor n=1 Tax=Propionibacterium freudenreichii TaxID=1744 RepID=UPI0005A5C3F5|nr:metalloregulator ArsR/SmtB family transcription factor [Propionibacterium freudenreichii]MDN5985700.1 metalloregulator ArsR/SmtB family transcription factor [Propionibacterium sp.]MCT2980080.1 transcriptional regulator [Propionibacterium freudenreichii]MCT2990840.1 transcriptional regulator [Propionibacterium freudenreichii]MCT2992906.1 transcriptional regulator [Propionibacterium freudenreichii]MCT2997242.1 transcriptional regulator [Propionibacterium freudenreichii]